MRQLFSRRACLIAAAFSALSFTSATKAASAGGDPFAEYVRKTEALSPAEEQKVFHLPSGFEIQLVASEPDIGKPINIQFDSKGRLWMTQSKAYPFPDPRGANPGDCIKILSDFDENGKAQKITTFADNLDIPVGIYPYKDGAIAYSIPNIWYFADTDGDGKCDKRTMLYTAFGYKDDTHGMSSNYRRGYDGWIYGCHGFKNESHVKGSDGKEITMVSGNTYRFRPDGSHIEIYSHGQVNPFGCTFDALGNMYTSDSHSKPNYQILHDGYYESFNPTDDGLGLAPMMMTHLHGSTAIAGIMVYDADQFPAVYRGNTFIGNVVTSRVNRDSLTHKGSSPIGNEEPDFLSTDDPWFRPNQVILGPDGAMWVSDFYNRIIAHYEVPLDHPGRDRERGRIWRIVYKGTADKAPAPIMRDWSKGTPQQLCDGLADHNLTTRILVMNELVDRCGKDAIDPVREMMKTSHDPFQHRHGLWVLYRLGALDDATLTQATHEADAGTRVHAMRVLEDMPKWESQHRALAFEGLKDTDPLVQRCAAAALQQHPSLDSIRPLLALRASVSPADTHLMYVTRMALREQFKLPGAVESLAKSDVSDRDLLNVADVLLAVPTPASADFIASHLDLLSAQGNQDKLMKWVRHASQHVSPDHVDALADAVQKSFASDLDLQIDLFHSIQQGMAQRGAGLSTAMRSWGSALAHRAINDEDSKNLPWQNRPIAGAASADSPWGIKERECSDGTRENFIDSIVGGEQLTGELRSKVFTLPKTLSFQLAGHDNRPEDPIGNKNFVRLRDADTDKVLKEAVPPRRDKAKLVKWDLSKFAGTKAYLQVIDDNEGSGYAWIAIGHFDPPVLTIPRVGLAELQQRQRTGAELAGDLKLTDMKPDLEKLVADSSRDPSTRVAAVKSIAAIAPDDVINPAQTLLNDPREPMSARQDIAKILGDNKSPGARDALLAAFKTAPHALQTTLALSIASSPEGAEALFSAIKDGKAPPMLLQDQTIKERLVATNVPDLDARIAQLTKGLTPTTQRVIKLIEDRRAGFAKATTSVEAGRAVFAHNCMVCHSINNQGAHVGPNLDGIGNRGVDRLMEDVLDPNRNVDPAFRYSNVFLKDGDVVTGLFRREEGETLIFTNSQGKDVVVQKSNIQKRVESKSSLMPENFGEILKPDDFYNLISYLLSNRPNQEASNTASKTKAAQ